MKGLYAIIDPEHCAGRDPLWIVDEVLAGGCAALQLRAKLLSDRDRLALSRAVAERCRLHGVPFWVNDRVDIALLVEGAGVHLGQEDLPLAEARQLFGRRPIGRSTHSAEQARLAEREGADLIGFGPIFPTRSKLRADPCVGVDGLAQVAQSVSCPTVAIGGITVEHAAEVTRSGAAYAAVIGAVCLAERPSQAARALHAALLHAS
jgi:thiamine-phosphate pyrophosphorylase